MYLNISHIIILKQCEAKKKKTPSKQYLMCELQEKSKLLMKAYNQSLSQNRSKRNKINFEIAT